MRVEEFISKSPDKVRKSPDLMAFYLREYEKIFGRLPNCAGCTFKSDWKKFVQAVKAPKKQKIKTMATTEKTFKLKDNRLRILTYWLGKSPQRKYSNKLTEEFVIGYLTHGTKEQLEARRKEFAILPKGLNTKEEIIEEKQEAENKEVIIEKEKEAKKVAEKPKKKTSKKSK